MANVTESVKGGVAGCTFRLDSSRQTVSCRGKVTELTPVEFQILEILVQEPGRVYTRETIIETLTRKKDIDMRTIDAHMKNMRKKLGKCGDCIITIRAVGYKLWDSGKGKAPTSKGLSVDTERFEAYCDGKVLGLSYVEFRILEMLLNSPRRVFSREDLTRGLWGKEKGPGLRTIDAHMKNLRKKLGKSRDRISTARGKGYTLAK